MRLALAFNFNNKEGFLEAMSKSGIDEARLGLIWNNETHDAIENDRLAQAEKKKMSTKTWITSGDENCCPECEAMDGETVPINNDFSCGTMTAHLHPNCNCSTTFE